VNFLDRTIGFLNPSRGLSRARARAAISALSDYEAGTQGRRTANWLTRNSSANLELQSTLALMRSRHRDLVRNNPWAARAVQAVVANTVGHGITGELKNSSKGLAADWLTWCGSTDCDADGIHDIYGLTALAMRAVATSGDVIIRARFRKKSDGYAIPLQIQLLEGDYLDSAKTSEEKGGKRIIQGIQFDAIGQREGFWMYKNHPGDSLASGGSVFVPADRASIIYRPDRPGQVRGAPWGHSAMITLRDLDEYEDAFLLRQKLANCVTGFVYDHSPDLSGGETNLPMPETLEPGLIAGLPAGKEIKFNDPPKGDDYGPYTRDVLLRVAAAYGITYQALTGDLSSVNFSSGRMGWLEMHRNIEQWRWHMLIPMMLERISKWWFEAAALSGKRVTGRERVAWTPPRREMLDPTKEVAAALEAVRGGLYSLPQVHRESGLTTSAVFAEIAEANKMADELGLVLTSDGRNQNKAAPQPAAAPSPPDEPPESDE